MKVKALLSTILLFALTTVSCFAQLENPCGGNGDPDDTSTCPLDTWVLVLVVAALVFATFKLHRKQYKQVSL